MLVVGARAVVLLSSIALGGGLGGPRGLIIGVALEPLLCYPVVATINRRYGTWTPALDAAGLLGSVAAASAGILVFG